MAGKTAQGLPDGYVGVTDLHPGELLALYEGPFPKIVSATAFLGLTVCLRPVKWRALAGDM